MSLLMHKLLMATLAVTLVASVAVPTVAQAAATDPTDTTTDTTNAYPFSSFELPYSLVVDSKGKTHHVLWYPNENSQTLTTDEVNAPDWGNDFQAKYPSDFSLNFVTLTLGMLVQGQTAFSTDDTLGGYILRIEGKPTTQENLADLTTNFQARFLYMTWLLKSINEYVLNSEKFTTIKDEYTQTMRDKVAIFGPLLMMKPDTYDSIFTDEQAFKAYAEKNATAAENHLTGYTSQQLTQLDPEATSVLAVKTLREPLVNYVTKQPDGKDYQADGLLSSLTGYPNFYVFKRELKPDVPTTATSRPVTIHYIDDQGHTLRPDKTLTGSLNSAYHTSAPTIAGYDLIKTSGQPSGTFSSTTQTVTYTYQKSADKPVVKNSVVYTTKRTSLYAAPTFTKSGLKYTYANRARMNRPMFKVIGNATAKNGAKRYKVRDLNGLGLTGYITADTKTTTPLYYAEKPAKVTVLNPKGINGYRRSNLTGKAAHYRQGQILKVKQIVHHHLTTRLLLANGQYVTANKKLVIAGKTNMPTRVRTKTGINRYGTANLTKKNKHFAKKTTLKVTGWAYSNANNFSKGDTLRYRIDGGYITGNKRFVQALD